MGYLTTRDETTRMGATEWAAPACDALVAFAAKRGLSLDNPAIETWYARLATAPQLSRIWTEEEVDAAVDRAIKDAHGFKEQP